MAEYLATKIDAAPPAGGPQEDLAVDAHLDWLIKRPADLLRRLDAWLLDPVSDVDTQELLREARARIAQMAQERDKWLDLFNRSEQFQSGPTKRAEQAEAQLRAAEARVRELEGKR